MYGVQARAQRLLFFRGGEVGSPARVACVCDVIARLLNMHGVCNDVCICAAGRIGRGLVVADMGENARGAGDCCGETSSRPSERPLSLSLLRASEAAPLGSPCKLPSHTLTNTTSTFHEKRRARAAAVKAGGARRAGGRKQGPSPLWQCAPSAPARPSGPRPAPVCVRTSLVALTSPAGEGEDTMGVSTRALHH